MANRIMFGIPQDSRLVRVHYMNGTTQQSANIDNPKTSAGLQVALLKKGIGMSQVKRVESVLEYAPRQ